MSFYKFIIHPDGITLSVYISSMLLYIGMLTRQRACGFKISATLEQQKKIQCISEKQGAEVIDFAS